jgi:hypothetical protein
MPNVLCVLVDRVKRVASAAGAGTMAIIKLKERKKEKEKKRHWAHELQDGTIYKVTTVPFVAATTVYGISFFPTDFLILKKKKKITTRNVRCLSKRKNLGHGLNAYRQITVDSFAPRTEFSFRRSPMSPHRKNFGRKKNKIKEVRRERKHTRHPRKSINMCSF